jgi:hypothetical protein
MEGSELNVIEQNTARPDQFFVLSKLLFFFKPVLDFKNPFVTGFRTFKNIDNRTHRNDEHQNPFIAELIHGPVN